MPRNYRKNGRKTDRFIESNSERDGGQGDRNYFSELAGEFFFKFKIKET